MIELKIRPLPVVEQREPIHLPEDCGFIDETVVRQMILDGNPDTLPATGNPCLPPQDGSAPFRSHPLAFAS